MHDLASNTVRRLRGWIAALAAMLIAVVGVVLPASAEVNQAITVNNLKLTNIDAAENPQPGAIQLK